MLAKLIDGYSMYMVEYGKMSANGGMDKERTKDVRDVV